MKQFYLIGNEGGIRFVPSIVLRSVIPCMIYGEMSIDDDFSFSLSDLKSFNDVICRILKDE